MKVHVVIKHTQTATIDIGNIPLNLIRDLLVNNDGTFDSNWSLGDIREGDEHWSVEDIEVTEVSAK